ncbi:PHP domain-containing protein [Arcanobacterium hippocoleae]|uniref:PHP domain-containing protein n=1 Tax=Arcanobacterium hippocoleae TaxID=149017 RepID=UPI00333E7D4C
MDVLGLTDHDTIGGWNAAVKAAKQEQICLVRGMETTTNYDGVIVHLLAYLFDPNHPKLQEHFLRMRSGRRDRVQEMACRLAADYPISVERILASAGAEGTLGRPHLADELVRIGVIANRSQAFAEIIKPGSKYYVRNESPNLLDFVGWIREAGGKSVIAHPKAPARGKILSDAGIRESAAAGLFGIEIAHRDNADSERAGLKRLADELGLAEFGSSDYHGAGKPNRIGENTTCEDVYRELIRDVYLPVISACEEGTNGI